FEIVTTSFFEINTRQGEQLYRVAREFADLRGHETVYDLYCGTGRIGIFLSKKAKRLVGVEMIDAAVKDARENAALNNLSNVAEFYAGDVIDVCNGEFFLQHGKPDVLVAEPVSARMHGDLVKPI